MPIHSRIRTSFYVGNMVIISLLLTMWSLQSTSIILSQCSMFLPLVWKLQIRKFLNIKFSVGLNISPAVYLYRIVHPRVNTVRYFGSLYWLNQDVIRQKTNETKIWLPPWNRIELRDSNSGLEHAKKSKKIINFHFHLTVFVYFKFYTHTVFLLLLYIK